MKTRRALLRDMGKLGLASVAMSTPLGQLAQASTMGSAALGPMPMGLHHLPSAKRVIFLWLQGGISQFESFENKPLLTKLHDTSPLAYKKECGPACLKSLATFKQQGESGTEVSDFFPHIGSIIDEFTLIRTFQNFAPAHPAAGNFLFSGERLAGKPSLGSWINYAIGSENPELPGFINLGFKHSNNKNGYLPSDLHGVYFATDGVSAVDFLDRPGDIDAAMQRMAIDQVSQLDKLGAAQRNDRASLSHAKVYELAYMMQSSIPKVMNLADEPDYIRKLYGLDQPHCSELGGNLLSARRLIESGVRFVNVSDQGWDHHSGLDTAFPKKSAGLDQPLTALILDLKQRGLLDDTLVVVTGEFGRTPFNEGKVIGGTGRGHNPDAGVVLLAGGGIRQGYTHGETDEFGWKPVRDPVTVNDLNASILHALGIDHMRLSYELGGRNFRATGVGEPRVVSELFA